MFSLPFLFPLIYFVQPGVAWPGLAPFYPLQIVSVLVFIMYVARRGQYPREVAFGHAAFKWMLAFMAVQSLSVIHEGMRSVFEEFTYLAPIAQFVILSILLVNSPENFRRYVWGMVVGSLWIVGIGIYATLAGLRGDYGGLAGAYGNYENHNDYTFIIVQTLPFIYLLRSGSKNFFTRLFLSAGFLACLYGTILSMSRGGIIAIVLEIALIVMLTMTRKRRNVLLPIVLVVGLAAIVYQYHQRAETNGDNYTAEDAKDSRFELWKAGRNMILAHPILGVGNRRFSEEGRNYGELSHDQYGKNSHNTYIEVAATTGLLGVLTFGGMLMRTRRELRVPMTPTPTDSGAIHDIRVACLIGFYTLLFRAFFDAKGHDWSFYLFVVIAAGVAMHRQRYHAPAPEPALNVLHPSPHSIEQGPAR